MPANPKPQKLVPNLPLRTHVENLGCLKRGCREKAYCHHVKSRGSGGKDEFNLVPLCFNHHTEIHQIGREAFERKYSLPGIKALAVIFTMGHYGQEKGIVLLAQSGGIDMECAEAIILNAIDKIRD